MPEQLNQEQQKYLNATTEFIDTLMAKKDRPARDAVIAASKKAGLYTLTQPEKYGGLAANNQVLSVVREALAAANAPFSHWVFGAGPGVLSDCNAHVESSFLIPMLNGELRSAFAFTEPANAPHPTSAASQGDHYIVNGNKSYVTGGADADFINTYLEVLPDGNSMLIIETGSPGVTIDKVFQSLDGSHHAEMSFKDVRVPKANLLGTAGKGLPRAMKQIGDTRLAFAAEAVGLMRWICSFVEVHIQAPHASGKSLGQREGVRLRYADMRINTYAARSVLYRTARLADSGENVMNEVIAAKVFTTETLAVVLDSAIQLVGGKALVESHPLAILYRRIRALRIAEGPSDLLRLSLSRGALELKLGRL